MYQGYSIRICSGSPTEAPPKGGVWVGSKTEYAAAGGEPRRSDLKRHSLNAGTSKYIDG